MARYRITGYDSKITAVKEYREMIPSYVSLKEAVQAISTGARDLGAHDTGDLSLAEFDLTEPLPALRSLQVEPVAELVVTRQAALIALTIEREDNRVALARIRSLFGGEDETTRLMDEVLGLVNA